MARSLVELVTGLPALFMNLLRAEAKDAGVGIGLFAAALAIALLLLPVLIAAAILAFATILPAWAAALIVAGIMIVIIAVLVLFGILAFKKIGSAAPEKTIGSVKSDIDAVKGVGDYDL